jgi:hypothetical protein
MAILSKQNQANQANNDMNKTQSKLLSNKRFPSTQKPGGNNVVVNTQTWQDAFKYSFYNPHDGMKNTMSNFNKTQMQGMMRATKISRNKNQSRTGNSSA